MVDSEVDTDTDWEVEGFSVEVVSEVEGSGTVGYPGWVVDSVVDSEVDTDTERVVEGRGTVGYSGGGCSVEVVTTELGTSGG